MPEIYVDADACPVKDEIVRVAERHQLKVKLVSNSGMFGFHGHPLVTQTVVSEAAATDDGMVFANDAIRAPLGDDTPSVLAGRKVVLGIRSEHVRVNSGPNAGEVRIVEPLGDASLVFFEFGNADRLVAKVDPDLEFRADDRLTFEFEPENCHLFDAESGVRLN